MIGPRDLVRERNRPVSRAPIGGSVPACPARWSGGQAAPMCSRRRPGPSTSQGTLSVVLLRDDRGSSRPLSLIHLHPRALWSRRALPVVRLVPKVRCGKLGGSALTVVVTVRSWCPRSFA